MLAVARRPLTLGARVALAIARQSYEESLAGKSPRTAQAYGTALDRFFDFLSESGLDPASGALCTEDLPADAVERFYVWLVRRYGRTARTTHAASLAGVSSDERRGRHR